MKHGYYHHHFQVFQRENISVAARVAAEVALVAHLGLQILDVLPGHDLAETSIQHVRLPLLHEPVPLLVV